MYSRCEILLENYCKVLGIESLTMLDMVRKDILPAVCSYMKDLGETASAKRALSNDISCELEETLLKKLSTLCICLYKKADKLDTLVLGAKQYDDDIQACARYYNESVFVAMQELRAVADELETIVGEKYWPFPTYSALLFSI